MVLVGSGVSSTEAQYQAKENKLYQDLCPLRVGPTNIFVLHLCFALPVLENTAFVALGGLGEVQL